MFPVDVKSLLQKEITLFSKTISDSLQNIPPPSNVADGERSLHSFFQAFPWLKHLQQLHATFDVRTFLQFVSCNF